MAAIYPFFTGQVPTAEDFNQLAVRAELASAGGAALIGYGSTTVAAALASITAPPVTSVAGRTGAITLAFADVSGVAALTGDATQNFSVKNATGSQHAIPLGQADARYAPIGSTGTGTVTSVGLSLPAELTVSGSPVTSTGTLTAGWASQTAAKVFASPTGATGTPVFRSLALGDLPTIDIAHGGTGQTSAQAAINALTGASGATNEYVLTKDTATGNAIFKPAGSGSGVITQALTGQYYQNYGARIDRLADRVFLGDAVVNDGNSPNVVKDWAEIAHGNTTSVSQLAAVSNRGQIGVFGATRSQDNNIAGSESGIGICGFAYNDHPSSSSTRSVFAGYFEAQRNTTTKGHVQGIEIDVVNLSTNVESDPYNMLPDGITGTLWCNAGGGNSSSNYISIALGFLGNGTRFNRGIVFGNAIIKDDGRGQPAICMAQQQKISWYGGVGTEIARIRSDTASSSVGIIFETGAISLRDMSDNVGFRFTAGSIQTPLTDLSLEPGGGYVNINSSALGGSAGGVAYYLPIKVNGTIFKLALLSP